MNGKDKIKKEKPEIAIIDVILFRKILHCYRDSIVVKHNFLMLLKKLKLKRSNKIKIILFYDFEHR